MDSKKMPMKWIAILAIFILTLAILGMIVFEARAGEPTLISQVMMFGALLAISLGMLIWYGRGLRSLPISKGRHHVNT
jgi:hypothetical protein